MAGTKGFRYVYSVKHIKIMLDKVQETNRPPKLSFPYIRDNWLLKNHQYSAVTEILKDMDFINSSGIPTELYGEYQNRNVAKVALAKGIKNAYSQLFAVYPNAQSIPKTTMEGFFTQQTGKTGSVLEKMASTFKALCNLADFSSTKVQAGEIEVPKGDKESMEEKITHRIDLEPNIQVNIGINIAADTPDDKIRVIFENMKKYLLTKDRE